MNRTQWKGAALVCAAILWMMCVPSAGAAYFDGQNCREITALWFGETEEAALLGSDPADSALADYFASREGDFRGEARLLSEEDGFGPEVCAGAARRQEGLASMEERLHMALSDASVTVRILEDSGLTPEGLRTLYVYEWTFFDYDDLDDGPGGNDVTGYGTYHKLTVRDTEEGLEILSDEYDESDMLGVSTLAEDTRAEFEARGYLPTEEEEPADLLSADFPADAGDRAFTTERPDTDDAALEDDAAELLAIRYAPEYDVNAAIAYSEKYVWHGASGGASYPEYYNPDYPNYNSVGGDCANFTSQSLNAGGLPQVVGTPYGSDGWYFKTATNRSATWAGSTAHRRWMGNNRGNLVSDLTNMSTASAHASIFPGSPVYYSTKKDGTWQHTVICAGLNSTGRPYINSHNHDRWHAVWNYYTSSGQIDTVQLTSDNFFGKFSGFADVGTGFYANLYNASLNRCLTNDGGTVTSRTYTGSYSQLWYFQRLSDGSYRIANALDGRVLAASEGGYLSRTPIVTETYRGDPGQQWYLYSKNGSYLFRPACTDRVMDIAEGSGDEGAGVWTFGRNDINGRTGVEAQLFRVRQTELPDLDAPAVTAKARQDGVNLSWTPVDGAAAYVVRVTQSGEPVKLAENIQDTVYSLSLQPGAYAAAVQAVANTGAASAFGTPVPFTVEAETPAATFSVTYDANGGTGAPEAQVKIEGTDLTISRVVPVREGFAFVDWRTKADGSGTGYAPGALYQADAPLNLYASWKADAVRVTLDPNGGTVSPASLSSTEVYGTLPKPEREGYDFVGWYTALKGGKRVSASAELAAASDHTLYARWEPEIYHVTLDPGEGQVSPEEIEVIFSVPYGYYGSLPTPVWKDHSFLGWFSAPDSTAPVTDTTVVESAGDHTLYARWESDTFLVSLNALGGTVAPESVECVRGGTYGTLPVPVRAGYIFRAWYTDPEAGHPVTGASPVVMSFAHTLYARWDPADAPSLESAAEQKGETCTVRVTARNLTAGTILAAGYEGEQFLTLKSASLTEGGAVLTLTGNFDRIKVMAFDPANRPLCAAAEILRDQFTSPSPAS